MGNVGLMGSEQSGARPTIVISGSLAYDHIMTFPGSFEDHIIPGKVHVLSVSFLFDSLVRHRGGVAGNVAYSFALLGERPALVGGGGSDFADYRVAFEELGIDTTYVRESNEVLTGSAFMTTDLAGNQIAGFYPGASSLADDICVTELAENAVLGIIGPTTREAMQRHAREIGNSPCRLVYDASQQVVSLSADELREGIGMAWGVVGSDYEMAVIENKTGLTVDDLVETVPFVTVTRGVHGSVLYANGEKCEIPAAPADPINDPTGGGDAYRAGLFKGLMLGLPLAVSGRLGSLAGTYAVEQHGTQQHHYTAEAFVERFDRTFPEYAGGLQVDWLRRPVDSATANAHLDALVGMGAQIHG